MQKLRVHEWAGFALFGGVAEFVQQRAEYDPNTGVLTHYIDGVNRATITREGIAHYAQGYPEMARVMAEWDLVPAAPAPVVRKPAAKPKPKGRR